MRVDLKKMLFLGAYSQLKAFFNNAQEVGLIHFIETNGIPFKEVPADIQHFNAAIKILRGLPTMEQEEPIDPSRADQLAHTIIELKNHIEKLQEELRVTELEMARVEIFGDFSMKELALLEKETHRKIQFFFGKRSTLEKNQEHAEVIYIGSDHGLDYFISINPEPKSYEGLVEMHIEHPIGELRIRRHSLLHDVKESEHKLKSHARYNAYLHSALINGLDVANLSNAQNCVKVIEGSVFAVFGWVPFNRMDELHALLDKQEIYAEEVAVEPSDAMPTCLQNESYGRIGEDVIHIYDTPSNTDKDPSSWVLWAFALFFGIIVGDAGYGSIYLAIALFLRYKFPQLRGFKKRALNLMTILSVGAVIWGVLIHSYFAIPTPMDSPVRKFSMIQWLAEKKADYHLAHKDETYDEWVKQVPQLKEAKSGYEFLSKGTVDKEGEKVYVVLDKFSDGIMMEIALFIGVIHLFFSLARYLPRNLTHLGWMIFLVGAYLYFPVYLDATSLIHYVFGVPYQRGGEIGLQILFIGIGLAFLVSLVKNKFLVILEAMTLVQIFADVLSYLRLYALGLSGAIVGATINELAAMMPFIFAVIALVCGHLVNMLLGVMSGVIHGLRLNFIEWYHYSFEGGGKKFQPLKLIDVEE